MVAAVSSVRRRGCIRRRVGQLPQRGRDPLFPTGFTIVDGYGQWKGDAGTVGRESSKILILLHDEDVTSNKNLETIRRTYKQRFGQESVIRSDQVAYVDF
jgi:hypothetical protein